MPIETIEFKLTLRGMYLRDSRAIEHLIDFVRNSIFLFFSAKGSRLYRAREVIPGDLKIEVVQYSGKPDR